MAKYGYYSISASVPFTLRLPIQAFARQQRIKVEPLESHFNSITIIIMNLIRRRYSPATWQSN